MTKNIAIAVLVIVAIASLSFGYTQKLRADDANQLAELYAVLAQKNEEQAVIQAEIAHQQTAIAEAARAEADRQRALAHSELERMKARK